MKSKTRIKLQDFAVNALAFVLAGSCGLFAGYMILRLQGMENPPADMGTNFPPAKKKMITDQPVEVDPQVTNSIDTGVGAADGAVVQPYTRQSPVLERHLLMVADGIAVVRVVRADRTEILPLGLGAELPGAGTIRRIERGPGGWRVVADDAVLEQLRR